MHFGGQDFRLPYTEILKSRRVPYNLDDNYQEQMMLQWHKAMKLAEEASQANKERVITRRNLTAQPIGFKVGQIVYLKNMVLPQKQCKKWNLKYLGPYTITRQLSPVNFEIKAIYKKDTQIVHVDRLKLAKKAEYPSTALARDKLLEALKKPSDAGQEESIILDPYPDTRAAAAAVQELSEVEMEPVPFEWETESEDEEEEAARPQEEARGQPAQGPEENVIQPENMPPEHGRPPNLRDIPRVDYKELSLNGRIRQ